MYIENPDSIDEELSQVRDYATAIAKADKANKTYTMVSVRSIAVILKLDPDPIIQRAAERGFKYCIDHTIPCFNAFDEPEETRPSRSVCYWGADQLASRLNCVI